MSTTPQATIPARTVPITAARHARASLEPRADFAFCASTNAVPLTAAEFPSAADEYAIVFASDGQGGVMPAVVLGMRDKQNLYLSADQAWQARYIPAFIRRHPFVFSSDTQQRTLTLCIDETHPGFNDQGRGRRLFTDDGKPTDYVNEVLRFMRAYETQLERTRQFSRRIAQMGLLEPMQARLTLPGGGTMSLGGFQAVNRQKLRSLDGAALAALASADELELLYLHLHSMRNFEAMKQRLAGAAPAAPEPEPPIMPAPATTLQ